MQFMDRSSCDCTICVDVLEHLDMETSAARVRFGDPTYGRHIGVVRVTNDVRTNLGV